VSGGPVTERPLRRTGITPPSSVPLIAILTIPGARQSPVSTEPHRRAMNAQGMPSGGLPVLGLVVGTRYMELRLK